MTNIPPLEQHRLDVYVRLTELCNNTRRENVLLIIRSGLLINAGALFTFPALIAAFGNDRLLSLVPLLLAGGCFVIGLMAAAGCGYAVYFNMISLETIWRERWNFFFEYNQNPERINREGWGAFEKIINQNMQNVSKTYIWGNISGILSYVAFMAGCCVTGWVILQI